MPVQAAILSMTVREHSFPKTLFDKPGYFWDFKTQETEKKKQDNNFATPKKV